MSTCPVDICHSREAWAPNRAVANLVDLGASPADRTAYQARVAEDTSCLENEVARVYRHASDLGLSIFVENGDLMCQRNRNLFLLASARHAGLVSSDTLTTVMETATLPSCSFYDSGRIPENAHAIGDASRPAVLVPGRIYSVCLASRNTWMQRDAFYPPKK